MKTLLAPMTTHLSGVCTTLSSIIRITRTDGQVFYFTDHDRNLVFNSNTYRADIGYDRTAVKNQAALAVNNSDIVILANASGVTETALRAGLFDRAAFELSLVNWEDPDTYGEIKLQRGWFGDVQVPLSGNIFGVELRGLTQALQQNILEVYGPECNVDLGSAKCGMPIQPAILGRNAAVILGEFYRVETDGAATGQAKYENRIYEVTTAGTTAGAQPTYDETPGNTTTDGTAVLTAREAWTRHAVVATVTDRRVFTITVTESRAIDGWFDFGAVTFETGDSAGATLEIKSWVQSTNTVTLYLESPFDIQVGDALRLYPGCDKLRETCFTKFSNVLNFRGFPDLPGLDKLQRVKE